MYERIPFTHVMYLHLKAEKERTGLGVQALLRGRKVLYPDGFDASIIIGCMNGNTQTLQQNYYDFISSLYALTPGEAELAEINSELKERLIEAVKASGKSPYALMRNAQDPPKGVSSDYLKNIVYGGKAKLTPERLRFLIKVVEEQTI